MEKRRNGRQGCEATGTGSKNQGFGRQGSETTGTRTEVSATCNRLFWAAGWGGNSERVPGFARCDREVFRIPGFARVIVVLFVFACLVWGQTGAQEIEVGRGLLAAREFDAAAGHLDRAIALLGKEPDAATAHYLRAKVYAEVSDPAQAARQLEMAVSLYSAFPEAWSDLGQARKLMGDHSGAIVALRKAVSLAPNDSVAEYRLGEEYLVQHQPHLAVAPLRAAHRVAPQDHSILNAFQKALRMDGQAKEADEVKQELAALLHQDELNDETDMKAVRLNNEGAKLQSAGDLRGALEKYDAAVKLSPKNVPLHVNYAVALLRLGKWTDGLNELHESLLMDPENSKIKAALRDALSQAPAGTAPAWGSEFQ